MFNDFNTNGVCDQNENEGAVDVGVPGLTIRAFTGTDTLVDTAESGEIADPPGTPCAGGAYDLDLPDTTVRLELTVVRPWWPTRQLTGLSPARVRSDVQFVDASSAQTEVNFGVHRLSEYSVDNPTLFWPLQWAGPVTQDSANAQRDAIRGAPFFSKRPVGSVQLWDDVDGRVARGTFFQVGTVSGLGLDQSTEDLYAGAYQKRFAGLKDREPGRIFRITEGGNVTRFADVPGAGDDPHPTSNDVDDWVQCSGATVTSHPNCDFSWTEVGKMGLGSVVIDTENENLYTINLNNKRLYRYGLRGGAGAARARGAGAQAADSTEIPDPGCAGGPANWRPFTAAFDRVNEQLYVGGVCSAETSPDRANLRAVVYRVDDPRSTAPDFVTVLDFPLNYQRAASSGAFIDQGGPRPAFCQGPFYCNWQPWPTTATYGGRAPTAIANGFSNTSHPSYPLLSAITFAEDGSMILSIRDLIGDMGGTEIPGEIGSAGQGGLGPMSRGDMLRAGANTDGTFSLEQNGFVPPAGPTSAGQLPGANNWGYGPGIGPGGGHFYNPAPLNSNRNAPHPYQGGLTQIPGFADVVATSIHIGRTEANGLLWRDNTTGDTKGALENYQTPTPTPGVPLSGFAKANGLGDIDAFTGLAPVQIGNRLWYDVDRNGIQDADEEPVTRTVVELADCDGNVIRTDRTDSIGEYWFNIQADTCYRTRVPLAQPSLEGWVPTRPFAGDHRLIDSNGRVRNGRSVAFVRPKGTGRNNHSYDFGFHRPPPPPPNGEQPPPPNGAVDQDGPLAIAKHVVRKTQNRVEYLIIVSNGGPHSIRRVRVCDRLPAGLAFVGATRSGRRSIGRRVCWRFPSLSSGEQRELDLRTRPGVAALVGNTVNCVTARTRRARVRACAAVRGVRPPPVVTG